MSSFFLLGFIVVCAVQWLRSTANYCRSQLRLHRLHTHTFAWQWQSRRKQNVTCCYQTICVSCFFCLNYDNDCCCYLNGVDVLFCSLFPFPRFICCSNFVFIVVVVVVVLVVVALAKNISLLCKRDERKRIKKWNFVPCSPDVNEVRMCMC